MCMRNLHETALYEGRHEVKVLCLGRDFPSRVKKDGWKCQSFKRKKRSDGSLATKIAVYQKMGLVNYSEGLMYEALFVFF